MPKLSITQKAAFTFPKIVARILHTGKTKKSLPFSLESIKNFFRLNYVFKLFRFPQNLIPSRKLFSASNVNATRKRRIRKSFHKCERCIRTFPLIKYIRHNNVQMFGHFVYFRNVVGRIFSKFVTS